MAFKVGADEGGIAALRISFFSVELEDLLQEGLVVSAVVVPGWLQFVDGGAVQSVGGIGSERDLLDLLIG